MKYIIFPVNFYRTEFNDSFIKLNKDSFYLVKNSFDNIEYVVLEIGFGRGDFLLEYAKQNPNYSILGLEKSDFLVKLVSKRLEIQKITNVRLISSKAQLAVYFLIPDNFLDQVIINFPDPWPKKAHIHRRLLNHNFLSMLYYKMKKNSFIWFCTDVENYKDFVINAVNKLSNQGFSYKINNILFGFWDEDYQTKYLRKWLKQNKKIFSLQIVKY